MLRKKPEQIMEIRPNSGGRTFRIVDYNPNDGEEYNPFSIWQKIYLISFNSLVLAEATFPFVPCFLVK